jgi:DMSO/TMAO reductase YedYZ molybdopterin-dependent catalytic subunit
MCIRDSFWPHAWRYRPHPRPRDYAGRRRLLQRGALLAGGAIAWQGLETSAHVASLPGAERRFTGSYDAGGQGNDFPRTSWLDDDPRPISVDQWLLRVGGHVRAPFALDAAALDRGGALEAVLDCTGGWYARRTWRGVPLAALLDRAEPHPGARSVVVRGVTGYTRRYSIETARAALLATVVDDEPLTHGHGAPARLIVPGARGYDWVKWVTRIAVSRLPAWLDWPLPVS